MLFPQAANPESNQIYFVPLSMFPTIHRMLFATLDPHRNWNQVLPDSSIVRRSAGRCLRVHRSFRVPCRWDKGKECCRKIGCSPRYFERRSKKQRFRDGIYYIVLGKDATEANVVEQISQTIKRVVELEWQEWCWKKEISTLRSAASPSLKGKTLICRKMCFVLMNTCLPL